MKILFLNLPHKLSVSRRYRCSYHSPKYLLPPHDLIQLATCIRAWNNATVSILDTIPLRYSEAQTYGEIRDFSPDVIVAVTGVDIFGDDIECLQRLKKSFPSVNIGAIGYYPTLFSKEILEASSLDFIARCEPEKPLSNYLTAMGEGKDIESVAGLASRRSDGSVFVNADERLENLEDLPFPDYGLVNLDFYEEAFFGKRCGAILAIRGCPFSCTYCAPTYGHSMSFKSPETVVAEMKHLIQAGAQSIRFLDDTFTFNRRWTMEVCTKIIESGIRIPWSCLARVDTVDEELLEYMRKAGCKRLNFGIESYSPDVLSKLDKRIDPASINPQLYLVRRMGIETVGHFIVGAPFETDEDFELTVRGVVQSPLDFIIVNILTPYAGTKYFSQVSNLIEFSIMPYKLKYKDSAFEEKAKERYNKLYWHFYLRPKVWLRHLSYVVRHPFRAAQMLFFFKK